jgi:transposase InsO family protein
MAESILLCFSWDGLRKDCAQYVAQCSQCQRLKNKHKHYGHLPIADPRTTEPWAQVAVDLVGPWDIEAKNCKTKLLCLTIIDLATRWVEIVRIHEKTSENIALAFDRNWLNRYPRPTKVIHDQGTEFKSEFAELLESLGIEEVTTTVKNPRANAILERTHDVMANMLRTYDFENQLIDGKDVDWGKAKTDPMEGFISAVALAMRASHHTALGTSPGALVFGRDMFFPTKIVANWKGIHQKRRQDMDRRTERENARRHPYQYKIGGSVLIRHDMDGAAFKKKMANPTSGPFQITRVIGNHTLELKKGRYLEKVNIRRVQPFFGKVIHNSNKDTAQPLKTKSKPKPKRRTYIPAQPKGSSPPAPKTKRTLPPQRRQTKKKPNLQRGKSQLINNDPVRRSTRSRVQPEYLEMN